MPGLDPNPAAKPQEEGAPAPAPPPAAPANAAKSFIEVLKGIIAAPRPAFSPLPLPEPLLKGTLLPPMVARPLAPAAAAAMDDSTLNLCSVAAVISAKSPYMAAENLS